jgi:hypothetical protein
VRRFNYWAEGFACIAEDAYPPTVHADALLDTALAAIKPDMPVDDLARVAATAPPYRLHPVTQGAITSAIGLTLDAPVPTILESGEVYSVRVGLTDGANQHAIVSAMIALSDEGSKVLWRSGFA